MRKALLFISILIICAGSLSAQSDNPPNDTIFIELNLTENGVTAVDTSGNVWVYDFDEDAFVLGELPDDLERQNFEGKTSEEEANVELRCTEKKTIKRFEGSVLVGYDEYVDDDILVIGNVNVKGWIKGDIVSVNGRVIVFSNARVDGDIEAPEIVVKDGGEVRGREIIRSTPLNLEDFASSFSMDGVIVIIILLAFFLLTAFLYHTLMPRQLANVNQCINQNKLKTTFLGFILLFAMPVLIVLVAITIVGIILTPLIPILYIFAMVMGITLAGNNVGRKITAKYLSGDKQPIFVSMLGIFILIVPWIISMTFWGMGNDVGYTFGGIFLGVACLTSFYPIFSGLGGVLLTRFGFKIFKSWKDRQRTAEPTKAPAPPPIPSTPDRYNLDNGQSRFKAPQKPDLPKPPGSNRPDTL